MISIFSSYSYSIKPYGIYQFFCQGLSKIKGLHIKLWTSFFQLAFIAQRQRMQTINLRGKRQGYVTYSSDQENKISTIFNIFKQTFEFSGPYGEIQPAKLTNHITHINCYIIVCCCVTGMQNISVLLSKNT